LILGGSARFIRTTVFGALLCSFSLGLPVSELGSVAVGLGCLYGNGFPVLCREGQREYYQGQDHDHESHHAQVSQVGTHFVCYGHQPSQAGLSLVFD
jgi:hypothetical protein